MKKLLLLLCLTLFLSACGGPDGNGAETFHELRNIQLTVFADSTLSDVFGAVAERYREAYPGIRLQTQFGSSGVLRTQILNGADCDLFLSASTDIMDTLDTAGYLLENSRTEFLKNQLVLAVPAGNPRNVRNFAHMASLIRQRGGLFVAANAGDPLGAYTRKLFAYHFLRNKDLSQCVTYALDAQETVTRIRSDMADGGIIYRTNADGLEIVDTADASMCGEIVYSVAVLSESARPLAATAFLEYLTGPDAEELFTRAGFTPVTVPDMSWYAPYWESLTPEEFSPDTDVGDDF